MFSRHICIFSPQIRFEHIQWKLNSSRAAFVKAACVLCKFDLLKFRLNSEMMLPTFKLFKRSVSSLAFISIDLVDLLLTQHCFLILKHFIGLASAVHLFHLPQPFESDCLCPFGITSLGQLYPGYKLKTVYVLCDLLCDQEQTDRTEKSIITQIDERLEH